MDQRTGVKREGEGQGGGARQGHRDKVIGAKSKSHRDNGRDGPNERDGTNGCDETAPTDVAAYTVMDETALTDVTTGTG